MVSSLNEKISLIEHVFRCQGRSTDEVKQLFVQTFPQSAVSHRNAVYQLIEKFRSSCSVIDAPRSGRPIVLTPEKVTEIEQNF